MDACSALNTKQDRPLNAAPRRTSATSREPEKDRRDKKESAGPPANSIERHVRSHPAAKFLAESLAIRREIEVHDRMLPHSKLGKSSPCALTDVELSDFLRVTKQAWEGTRYCDHTEGETDNHR